MIGKLGFLLCFLQLWHFAMPNKTLEVLPEPIQRALFGKSSNSNFPIQIDQKSYYVEKYEKVNWFQAAHNCRRRGGNLLNIESSQEMDAILAALPMGPLSETRYWISLNCLAKKGNFLSMTTGAAMPYTRWLAGEPNNRGGSEFCVDLLGTGLNDFTCSRLIRYICELKPGVN